jgi:hypothetical protein
MRRLATVMIVALLAFGKLATVTSHSRHPVADQSGDDGGGGDGDDDDGDDSGT